MTSSAFHSGGAHPAGRWGNPRVLGALWIAVHFACLPVRGGAGETPYPSAGVSVGATATAESLPEGARVSSIPLLDGSRVVERLDGLPGLSNVARVAPGIFRGAQPRREGFETLRRMGIRTVINLRPGRDERAKVEAAGMRLVTIPIKSEDPDPEAIRKVVSVMADPANQPVFVHCKRGKHRVGVVTALHRMEKERWSRREAKAEMQALGYDEDFPRLTSIVDSYPARGKRTN